MVKKTQKGQKMVKKPQKSGKKAPAGNKRPPRATEALKIQKTLEKKQKKKQIY